MWLFKKASHGVACLVNPQFEGFRGVLCNFTSMITHGITGAQLFLVILVPAEQAYTVLNFGIKEPPKILTISIYIFLIYLISLAPHFASIRKLDLSADYASPLCLKPLSGETPLYVTITLSMLQALFPLAGTMIAIKVRSVAKKIYRSYVDRKSKLTVDERLEIEGLITAAKAVSAISASTALVYPYNMLLRIYGVNICQEDGICMSVVYTLAYSSGKCVATSVMLFALGFEIKEVRRKIWRLLRIRSRKVKSVVPLTVVEDRANETEARFAYLQNQWKSAVKTT